MAFWQYSQFPYCLCGEIEKMKGKLAYIESYQGWFEPFLVMDYDSGIELKDKMESLRLSKAKELKAIHDKYQSELDKIITIK